jgi:hypothetical protein
VKKINLFGYVSTGKPVITDLTSGQRVPMAQWIYMECHADGDPKPRITWYKDGEKIDFNNNYNYKVSEVGVQPMN